jgi:hypothetical protein
MNPKTWVEAHENEKFGDGGIRDSFKQCKDCLFRDKTTVQGKECGWNKCVCGLFEPPERKPLEFSNNTTECEYYEKDKNAANVKYYS